MARSGLKVALRALVLLAAAHVAAAAEPVPRRIVSLNLCTDQVLVDLVARERIAALSFLATDETLSSVADRAHGFKLVRGYAEEVLALDPDLVIAQEYSATATVDLLRRLGRNVVVLPLAWDFEGLRRGIRALASVVDEVARGETIIAEMDAKLAHARPAGPERPTALALQVNGLTAGPDNLIDAAMAAAGLDNLGRSRKLGPGGRLPLESVVADPPDLIVLANTADDFRSIVGDNLRHPALADVLGSRPSVHLPMQLWQCATPRLAEAVVRLARIRDRLVGKAQP